jgi:hypothetical protein
MPGSLKAQGIQFSSSFHAALRRTPLKLESCKKILEKINSHCTEISLHSLKMFNNEEESDMRFTMLVRQCFEAVNILAHFTYRHSI